ncbi:MAG: urease accessory protein UreD, partial [Thermomicrobiales bacterium]
YSRLDLRTRIWLNDDLLLQERLMLEPAIRPMQHHGRLGSHLVSGPLFLIGDQWTQPTAFEMAGVEWTAGKSDGLILVRVLGDTAQYVNATIRQIIVSAGFSLEGQATNMCGDGALHCHQLLHRTSRRKDH